MSVAAAFLQTLKMKVSPTADRRLWMGVEMLLVNDNGVPLAQMNFLGLLCLVKGGQLGPHDDPPMGYWNELELFRCADGCQTLAIKMAQQMAKKLGVRVLRQAEVTHIDVQATRASLAWRVLDKKGQADRPPGADDRTLRLRGAGRAAQRVGGHNYYPGQAGGSFAGGADDHGPDLQVLQRCR